MLRFLAAAGVVKEGGGPGGGAVYGLTAGGALLQTDIPGQPSLAPGVLHLCGKGIWESLELLPAAVAGELGDKSPFATSTGLEPFDYLEKYPGEMRVRRPSFVLPARTSTLLEASDF